MWTWKKTRKRRPRRKIDVALPEGVSAEMLDQLLDELIAASHTDETGTTVALNPLPIVQAWLKQNTENMATKDRARTVLVYMSQIEMVIALADNHSKIQINPKRMKTPKGGVPKANASKKAKKSKKEREAKAPTARRPEPTALETVIYEAVGTLLRMAARNKDGAVERSAAMRVVCNAVLSEGDCGMMPKEVMAKMRETGLLDPCGTTHFYVYDKPTVKPNALHETG